MVERRVSSATNPNTRRPPRREAIGGDVAELEDLKVRYKRLLERCLRVH